MNNKQSYFLSSLTKRIFSKGNQCPCCGYELSDTIELKYVVTSLERCRNCKLLYRSPTTSVMENKEFYQEAYSQGFTTDLPSLLELENLKTNNFCDTEKDYSLYIDILSRIANKGVKLFDYGCSWGYGSYQLSKAGFDVDAFEISQIRKKYARENLDINILDSLPDVENVYDVFFSSHVLEHVPSVLESINYGIKVLKPGGYFVALTPNGSEAFRKENKNNWHKSWGMVHPNLLDDCFYVQNSNDHKYLITSTDSTNQITDWILKDHPRCSLNLSGPELLCILKKAS